jgi:porin
LRGAIKIFAGIILGGMAVFAGVASAQASDESAAAQPKKQSVWERDKLTGDWRGLRSDLSKHGIDFDLRLAGFYQDVTTGGVDDSGNGEFALKGNSHVYLDMHKLFGTWEGLSIIATIESRTGDDVVAEAGGLTLPNAALLYPAPGEYSGTDVTGFMAVQNLNDGKFQILGGKLNAVDLINGMFPNIVDSGLDGYMNGNSMLSMLTWSRYLTTSLYGGGAWTMENGMAKTGIIVAGATNTATTWSMDGAFSDGAGYLAFHRFTYDVSDLPGYLYLDVGYSTKKYVSTDENAWVVLPGQEIESTDEKHPWGVAGYVSQYLWQKEGNDKRFVEFFGGGSIADDNPSLADWDVFASVQGHGFFDSRPKDRAGFAAHYNHMADDFVNLVSSLPTEDLGSEVWTTELYYNYEINPWLHVTPNLQYNQNENESDDPALIVGLRLVVEL